MFQVSEMSLFLCFLAGGFQGLAHWPYGPFFVLCAFALSNCFATTLAASFAFSYVSRSALDSVAYLSSISIASPHSHNFAASSLRHLTVPFFVSHNSRRRSFISTFQSLHPSSPSTHPGPPAPPEEQRDSLDTGTSHSAATSVLPLPELAPRIRVFFDGNDPLCRNAARILLARDYAYRVVEFIDIQQSDCLPQSSDPSLISHWLHSRRIPGLSLSSCTGRMHALLPNGEVIWDVQSSPQPMLYAYQYVMSSLLLMQTSITPLVYKQNAKDSGSIIDMILQKLLNQGFVVIDRFVDVEKCIHLHSQLEDVWEQEKQLKGANQWTFQITDRLLQKTESVIEIASCIDDFVKHLGNVSTDSCLKDLKRYGELELQAPVNSGLDVTKYGTLIDSPEAGESEIHPQTTDEVEAALPRKADVGVVMFPNLYWNIGERGCLRLLLKDDVNDFKAANRSADTTIGQSTSSIQYVDIPPIAGRIVMFLPSKREALLDLAYGRAFGLVLNYAKEANSFIDSVSANSQSVIDPPAADHLSSGDHHPDVFDSTSLRVKENSLRMNDSSFWASPSTHISKHQQNIATNASWSSYGNGAFGAFPKGRLFLTNSNSRQSSLYPSYPHLPVVRQSARPRHFSPFSALVTATPFLVRRDHYHPHFLSQAGQTNESFTNELPITPENPMANQHDGNGTETKGITNDNDAAKDDAEVDDFIQKLRSGKLGETFAKQFREIEEEEDRRRASHPVKDDMDVETVLKEPDPELDRQTKKLFGDPSTDLTEQEAAMLKFDEDDQPIIKSPDEATIHAKRFVNKYYQQQGLKSSPMHCDTLITKKSFYWRESSSHLEIWVPVPNGTKFQDIKLSFDKSFLSVGVRTSNQFSTVLEGQLYGKVSASDCYWVLNEDFRKGELFLHINCPKWKSHSSIWGELFGKKGVEI